MSTTPLRDCFGDRGNGRTPLPADESRDRGRELDPDAALPRGDTPTGTHGDGGLPVLEPVGVARTQRPALSDSGPFRQRRKAPL